MINYSIEQTGNGYTLTIWEPAPLTSDRVKPFVFKANYIISSPIEAFALLRLVQGGRGAVHKQLVQELVVSKG
jgi:hypothetical protein